MYGRIAVLVATLCACAHARAQDPVEPPTSAPAAIEGAPSPVAEAPPAPRRRRARRAARCERIGVLVARVWTKSRVEETRIAPLGCDGAPDADSLEELSILARPLGVERPEPAAIRAWAREHETSDRLTAEVIRLDPGLLVRLHAIAAQWPGRRVEIFSGYRPTARPTSRHRVGRALDLGVEGVSKEDLVAFARTLSETGVGFYPRSRLTHVDVRDRSAYWIDRSGPGEAPDYGPWPPAPAEVTATRAAVVAESLDAVREVETPAPPAPPDASPPPAPPVATEPDAGHSEPEVPLTPDEVAALRAEVRAEIARLRDGT
jgi:hypothetical protein